LLLFLVFSFISFFITFSFHFFIFSFFFFFSSFVNVRMMPSNWCVDDAKQLVEGSGD